MQVNLKGTLLEDNLVQRKKIICASDKCSHAKMLLIINQVLNWKDIPFKLLISYELNLKNDNLFQQSWNNLIFDNWINLTSFTHFANDRKYPTICIKYYKYLSVLRLIIMRLLVKLLNKPILVKIETL